MDSANTRFCLGEVSCNLDHVWEAGGTPPTLSALGIKLCLVTFSIPLQFVGDYYGLWGRIEGASLIFRQPLDS